MAARSKKNIAVGTQRGEGQVSQCTVVPISASSFTQPAEAGNNVEAGFFPISMPGATGVPAPESAVSQIQIPDIKDGRKGIGEMKPDTPNGGDPLVVGPNPTGSEPAAPLILAPTNWTNEEVLVKAESMFGFDCTTPTIVDFGDECTIDLGGCLVADGREFQVWYRTKIWVELHYNTLKVEPEVLGDVLANYEYGGVEAVEAYLDSIETDDFDEEPEGSESLAANSPEHEHIDSTSENGESNE